MQKRRTQSVDGVSGTVRRLSRPLLPSRKLQCFSVACLDMPQLEFGDKIVLPPKVLLELQCFKIPTPLLFKIQSVGHASGPVQPDADPCETQYCSVQEFSAPDGQVFLPYWLMQNLRVQEGESVVVSSIIDIPRAIYCRLQPESISFLDLAAEIGPKLLMETTLRRYSVLSEHSTILVEHGVQRYYVRVLELKPAAVVSLCGDIDLEMDFAPPEGFDLKRPSSGQPPQRSSVNLPPLVPSDSTSVLPRTDEAKVNAGDTQKPSTNTLPTSTMGYGRRLRDGGYVADSQTNESDLNKIQEVAGSSRLPLSSLQRAQQRVREQNTSAASTAAVAATAASSSSVLASRIRLAQPAFSTPGYTTGKLKQHPAPLIEVTASTTGETVAEWCRTPEGMQRCSLCLADLCPTMMELHSLRCAKNPAYHKFECEICHEKVLRVKQDAHRHCLDCECVCATSEELDSHQTQEHSASHRCDHCRASFTRVELLKHMEQDLCDHVLVPCELCGLAFKKKDSVMHERMCSGRTERCDICQKYVRIGEFDAHYAQCGTIPPKQNARSTALPIKEPSTSQAIQCVYCSTGGFSSITAVELHASRDCRVAKAFLKPLASSKSSNQERLESVATDPSTANAGELAKPILARGRIRRKGDIDALLAGTRATTDRPRRAPVLRSAKREQEDARKEQLGVSLPDTMPLSGHRAEQKRGKMRKPQARVNLQLHALPERSRGHTVTDASAQSLVIGGIAADLRVPSAGMALPRSRIGNQGRRKLAAALPPPGRLKKLP